jgi:uncharacterized protein (TIGR00369 family)
MLRFRIGLRLALGRDPRFLNHFYRYHRLPPRGVIRMPKIDPPDPDFEARVRASFNRQRVMQTIGARLVTVGSGEARIELPFRPELTQQHGYIHAGIIGTIVDSACGYAAYTLMPADSEVLTDEYKVNFLAPAQGETFVAIGRAIKPGRTLTVCAGEVWAYARSEAKQVAAMQATMMMVFNRVLNKRT